MTRSQASWSESTPSVPPGSAGTAGRRKYDAIVVGARCAGAPAAMLLGRRGHRVLLVDRSIFRPISGNRPLLIHQPGVSYLEQCGLFGKVRASGAPTITRWPFDVGPLVFKGSPIPDGMTCGDREVDTASDLRVSSETGAIDTGRDRDWIEPRFRSRELFASLRVAGAGTLTSRVRLGRLKRAEHPAIEPTRSL
jgi:hypothetical protein